MRVNVIAEAGMCMEGSIPRAVDMVHAAADAGCTHFKTQLLTPSLIAHPAAGKYWSDTSTTKTQSDSFTRAGLIPYDAWLPVLEACRTRNLTFLATPFDLPAVDALEDLGVTMYKLASGDITYRPLIERLAATGKPLLFSTGAATRDEIFDLARWHRHDDLLIPMACTLSYPTPDNAAHLARITALLDEWPVVGYSDHTRSTFTAYGATALGATYLEKHFTITPLSTRVPDHKMALDPPAMAEYVAFAIAGAEARGSESLTPVPEEAAAMVGARRSIYAARDLPADHLITYDDMVFLRPGTGISPASYPHVVGQRTKTAKAQYDPLP